MDVLQLILSIASTLTSVGAVCAMIYGFSKFLSKPRDTLEERVAVLESKCKEVETSLIKGNKNFEEQEETNKVLIHSVMALIEFEVQYCLTENKPMSKGLERVNEDLHAFLATR